jgi:hypothetical protein
LTNPYADLIPEKQKNPYADLIPASKQSEGGYVPIPSHIIPSSQPDELLVDKTGLTTALEVGPAVAGGVIGGVGAGAPTAGTGAPAGAILGGALGAAMGRGAANLAREIEKQVRSGRLLSSIGAELEDIMNGGDKTLAATARQAMDMVQAGTTDLAFGTGFHALQRSGSFALRMAGKAMGAQSPEVQQVVREAAESGVGVGAIDLDKPAVNIASKVLGVMPVIGSPIRTSGQVKAVQASRALRATLDDISPSIDLPALGKDMSAAAKKALGARRAIAKGHYARMRAVLNQFNGEIIPTDGIREQARILIGEMDALPKTQKGKAVGFPVSNDADFMEALKSFTELPDNITPAQLEALQKNLNVAARSRSGNQMEANHYRIITNINAATWDALDSIPVEKMEKGDAQIIQTAVRKAKRSWANLKGLEETAAAAPLKRTDRNFFAAGFEKTGTAEIDELANMYMSSQSSLRSPEFIDGLEALIGKKNRKALARTILQRAANPQEGLARVSLSESGAPARGSTEIAAFDPRAMRAKLGLSDPDKILGASALRQNRTALARLLEGSGVSVASLEGFLKTVERTQAAPLGDPSTFLARRFVLSGRVLSAVGVGGAMAAGQTGLLTLGTFILTTRQAAKLLSTPKGLKLLREGFKQDLTRHQKLQLAARIGRLIPDDDFSVDTVGGPDRQ